jgi:hypothetical protein
METHQAFSSILGSQIDGQIPMGLSVLVINNRSGSVVGAWLVHTSPALKKKKKSQV